MSFADPTPPPPALAPLTELERTVGPDATRFRHAREDSYWQMVALGGSTFVFMVFVVSVMPLMKMTRVGNALWTAVGIAILAVIGLATQARVRETRVRVDRAAGVLVEQGTTIDRETVAIAWTELAGVELEPVDPKDGRRGMKLRLLLRAGEPVDAFEDVAVGDLNEVRRTIADALREARLTPRA